MTYSRGARLLLKMPAMTGFTPADTPLSMAGSKFNLEVLCPNEAPLPSDRERPVEDLGIAGATARWFLATGGPATSSPAELWELAYETRRSQGPAMAGGPLYVEPDFEQPPWLYENPVRAQPGLEATPGDLCIFNDQRPDLPNGPGFAWHLRPEFSGLAAARATVTDGDSTPVRIGILDVGFDFTHRTRPENLRRDLQRNFAGDGRPVDDASDPYRRGLLDNPGHGTGTLGILAGSKLTGFSRPEQNTGDYLGGAPRADIIPVRIAESVVLWRTSSFAQGLDYLIAPQGRGEWRANVVSMSMGGLASRAWAEVVNRAYDAGIVMVTAAGNNYPATPSSIVFPARFNRVLAACGVMADGRPYAREFVPFGVMAGNVGPSSKMETALAAFTPNMPWAEINCAQIIDMDGAGTSSATPQIAATAALWLQQHQAQLTGWDPWQIVESVRYALFTGARPPGKADYSPYIGRGFLNAVATLAVAPPQREQLVRQPEDSAVFAFFRGLSGIGLAAAPDPDMLGTELTQLIHRDANVEASLRDPGLPPERVTATEREQLIDAVLASPYASPTLKQWLKSQAPSRGIYVPPSLPPLEPNPPRRWSRQHEVRPLPPHARRLRTYAFDPALSNQLDMASINEVVLEIPWESRLAPGPAGEYVEVIDHDPASGCFYAPVDLNLPRLLAADGLSPSTSNPQFHQQMVYAVAMRTIHHFEQALGRKALWSARLQGTDDSTYIGQLRLYPHALRERNAYYDPEKKALLFGYFPADRGDPGQQYPGEMIFTCLSADVVAHETTHALLDGMHRHFIQPSNPDVLAFHEAFADLVALFQHFSLPAVLQHQIARTRGDLRLQNLLGELAQQFGNATGLHGALRSAIGRVSQEGWTPLRPDPAEYERTREPHARGAILVAAVFEAFLAIYERRVADLVRLATGGTGVLPSGALHPDLVGRLSNEAAKTARQVLTMCIRALDYLPPVDVTFSDFLRAVITADFDLVSNDQLGYRIAFVDAFRRRGIYPQGVRTLAVDTTRWREAEEEDNQALLQPVLKGLKRVGDQFWHHTEREKMFTFLRQERAVLHDRLKRYFREVDQELRERLMPALGLDLRTGNDSFEVHALRFAEKVGPEGSGGFHVIISLLQQRQVSDSRANGMEFVFSGGCTLIADLQTATPKYFISKNLLSDSRLNRQVNFHISQATTTAGLYFGESPRWGSGQCLALLHALQEEDNDGHA